MEIVKQAERSIRNSARAKEVKIDHVALEAVINQFDGPDNSISIGRLGESAEMRIGMYDILRGSGGLKEDVFSAIAANAKYTGEKSGWYIDATILAEAQTNSGPTISAYRDPIAPTDEHWFSNNGLFGAASVYGTLNYYGTSLDSVDHTNSTIDALNSTQWRSTKLDGTPVPSSNVKSRGPSIVQAVLIMYL